VKQAAQEKLSELEARQTQLDSWFEDLDDRYEEVFLLGERDRIVAINEEYKRAVAQQRELLTELMEWVVSFEIPSHT
jgi:hypothetical protein